MFCLYAKKFKICKSNAVIMVNFQLQTMAPIIILYLGLPDDLLANVASIGRACKELNGAVDQYAAGVSEEIHRQLELEKRSVTSELRQVATQMQNVKKFNGTRVSSKVPCRT